MTTTKKAFDQELDRLGVSRALPALPATDGEWRPCRRGDGTITCYLECWWSEALKSWVSCPGASRVINAETGEIFEGDF